MQKYHFVFLYKMIQNTFCNLLQNKKVMNFILLKNEQYIV